MADIKKLELNDPDTKSADIVAGNIDTLKALFPEAFTEGRIDFEVLKGLLGAAVDERDEKYGLNWHGKRRARQIALTPSAGTLLPAPEESVDWDTTQNLMIEGDNLEVLKLLQKSYAGKVKLIYIDPPYNTGKDFVYPDDFRDSIKNYLEQTGQIEGGKRSSSNTESSGRFHTDWLNMLYPRVKLARGLMKEDGVLMASIDERELQNLRYVCDSVFGEECFVATLTLLCNPKGRSQDKYFATNHEYIVVYSKSPLPKGYFAISKDDDQIEAEYPEEDDGGKFRLLELRNTHREFGKHNRKNLYYPFFVDDEGEVFLDDDEGRHKVLPNWDDGFEGCWTWERPKSERDIDLLVGKLVNGRWKVYRKGYASGADRMLKTILVDKQFYTERGQKEFNRLFGTKTKLFQSPKSPFLIAQLLQTVTSGSDLILDFFAGSGTTAHAVMMQNQADCGSRRFIAVQLPEAIDPENKEQKATADYLTKLDKPLNISELTKERVRRSAVAVRAENPMFAGDTGFRVFKLDSSNIRAWEPDATDLANSLLKNAEHLVQGRKEQDVLYELLLKLGLDLCVPIEAKSIAGKSVHSIGGGALIVCLADGLTKDVIEPLASGIVAWRATLAPAVDTRVVFKDSGFADDIAKTNMAAILNQNGITDVRSL
jgi:adenine-specific DNA-methyltransferase